MDRQQLHRMAKAIDSDRLYFERHKDRRHRIRHAHHIEVEVSGLPPPPCGWSWFTAVKQYAPGHRGRLLVQSPSDAETDVSEAMAALIFASEVVRCAWVPGGAGLSILEKLCREA